MSQSWETTRTRHGTQSGWQLHKTLGERPCDPCYRAKAAYDVERRQQPEQVLKARDASLAQRKAYSRLAHRYPNVYRALYLEAQAELAARFEQPTRT